jgi:hypothetical protein
LGGVIAESLDQLKGYLETPESKDIFVTQKITLGSGDVLNVPGSHHVTFIKVTEQNRAVAVGDTGHLVVEPGARITIASGGYLEFRKGSTLDITTLDGATLTTSRGVVAIKLEDDTCVAGDNTVGALGQAGVAITVNGIFHEHSPSEGASDILRVKTISYIKAAFEPRDDDDRPIIDEDKIWFTPLTGVSAWGALDVRYGRSIYTENGYILKLPATAGNGYRIAYNADDIITGITYNSTGTNPSLVYDAKTINTYTLRSSSHTCRIITGLKA